MWHCYGAIKRFQKRFNLNDCTDSLRYTGRMEWMAHRKWKEIKQQPSMLPGLAVPGCCLISFHFPWAIHPIRPGIVTYRAALALNETSAEEIEQWCTLVKSIMFMTLYS